MTLGLLRRDPTVRQRLDNRTLGQVFSLRRLLKNVNGSGSPEDVFERMKSLIKE